MGTRVTVYHVSTFQRPLPHPRLPETRRRHPESSGVGRTSGEVSVETGQTLDGSSSLVQKLVRSGTVDPGRRVFPGGQGSRAPDTRP